MSETLNTPITPSTPILLANREAAYQEGALPWTKQGQVFPGYRVLSAHQIKKVERDGISRAVLDPSQTYEAVETLEKLEKELAEGTVTILSKTTYLEFTHLIVKREAGIVRPYAARLACAAPQLAPKPEEYETGTVRDMIKAAVRPPANNIPEEMRVLNRKCSPEFTVEQEQRITAVIDKVLGQKVDPTLAIWIMERVETEEGILAVKARRANVSALALQSAESK